MSRVLILLLYITGSAIAVPNPQNNRRKCGYESCTKPKDGVLNVHIVAHTHDDVGWLKTVDQYYYGNRNNIQKAGVQYILDSVVKELWEDPKRRFIYVETAFFSKWWHEQSADMQSRVQTLVQEGRLKFAGGAWSMNDEATTYYQSTIDQFTYGLRFLNETFGECGRPRVGWQIDPFGHSREFASLLTQMGYDGLFLGRIDYQDKKTRIKDKAMEFIWRGDDNLGKPSDIFTGILYNTYSPPPGFCFDVLCNDEPIVDDPTSPDYNVDRRVSQFIKYVKKAQFSYLTNNVLVTMGGDFTYQDAGMWYKNLDKLIKYGNKKAADENLNVNIFYSTPDCYLKAVKDANPVLPVKQDDFFPYASDPHSYWTGYFTSRPTIKFIEAEANRYTQMAKQLFVLADLPVDDLPVLDKLKSVMGVLQHHDAITGTEKQHVTYDYIRMISAALNDAHQRITTKALNKMIHGKDSKVQFKFDRCQFNETSCRTPENAQGNMIVTVYNPLAWPVSYPVSIPTKGDKFDIIDASGASQPSQTVPIDDAVKRIPSRKSTATHETVFNANIPALGYKSYYFKKVSSKTKRDLSLHRIGEEYNRIKYYFDKATKSDQLNTDDHGRDINDDYTFKKFRDDEMMSDEPMVVQIYGNDRDFSDQGVSSGVDAATGKLKTITSNGKILTLMTNAAYYPGFIGNNMVYENRSSGAYIFRPDATAATELLTTENTKVEGDLFKEERFQIQGNAYLAFRTYSNDALRYFDVNWIVGPITDEDGIGKEYVIQYQTNIITNGEFYTDSNGRTVLKRKLNERPQWNLTLEEPVAGNYYPLVDYACIKDPTWEGFLAVLPDRPQGGASLEEGFIEIMLHRRLLNDDAFGVGEALNETEAGKGLVVSGNHRVLFIDGDMTFKDVLEMRNKPEVFVTDAAEISVEQWLDLTTEKSWLKGELDDGLHLLTLEPWSEKRFLIRFENYLDKSEKSNKKVDIENALFNVKIKSVKETVLSADKVLHDNRHWVWRIKKEFVADINKDFGSIAKTPKAVNRVKKSDNGNVINLDAKEIRTFLVEYELQ